MVPRLVSLFLWIVASATAIGWLLHIGGTAKARPSNAAVVQFQPPLAADLSGFLGQPAPPSSAASAAAEAPTDGRYQLVGVFVRPGSQPAGVALISVQGRPVRAVVVGREVEPGLRLLSVSKREAQIGSGQGAPIVLRMPPPPEPQRGTLDMAVSSPLMDAGAAASPVGAATPQPTEAGTFVPPQVPVQPEVPVEPPPQMPSS